MEAYAARPAVRFRRRRTFVMLAMLGGVIGLLVQQAIIQMVVLAANSTVSAAPDYHLTVRPGDLVPIDFSADRDRECVTETERWLWRDNARGRREVVSWTYNALAFGHEGETPRDYRFLFQVPQSIPPGEWNVRTLHADYCWPWSYLIGPRLRAGTPFGIHILRNGGG